MNDLEAISLITEMKATISCLRERCAKQEHNVNELRNHNERLIDILVSERKEREKEKERYESIIEEQSNLINDQDDLVIEITEKEEEIVKQQQTTAQLNKAVEEERARYEKALAYTQALKETVANLNKAVEELRAKNKSQSELYWEMRDIAYGLQQKESK